MSEDIITGIGPPDGNGDGPANESGQSGRVSRPRTQLPEGPTDFELHVRQGPLPPPEDLAAYETAVPGAGDRILSMAERRLELAGRDRELHHTEFMKIVGANAATERLGQAIAGVFIISIMVVWGVIMLSEVEERLKIASTVFPAVIAGANAYRAIRNMWRRERSPADRSRDDSPPELGKAPGWDRAARD